MRTTRAALPAVVSAALLGILLTPAPAFAAGGTVYVDDDWAGATAGSDPDGAGPATSFGTDAFATVTDAVAAAPDRIELASGDYVGQLVIPTDVAIVGAGQGSTFLTAPPTPAGYTTFWGQNGIVVVDGADVVLSGVTIRGPQNGVPFMVGALVGGGGSLELSASTVRGIRDDPFSGAQRGVGVVAGISGGSTTGSVTLRDVLITDFQKLGVVIRQNSSALIEDTVIEGRGAQCINAANGIQLQGTATVRRTRVSDNRYADAPSTPGCSGGLAEAVGIRVSWPTGPVLLEDNVITGTEVAFSLSSDPGPGPVLTIRRNQVVGLEDDPIGNPLGDASWGIVSDWARDGGEFLDNTISRTRYGLLLNGAAEIVSGNSLRGNATGAQLYATPARFAANTIVGNTVGVEGAAVTSGGPNWWGCDDGPGAPGCDTATPDYTEADWLVLRLELPACTVTAGQTIPAQATLTTTASGVEYTDDTVPSTTVSFTGDARVSPTPAGGVTTDGRLAVLLRGLQAGSAQAEAHADNGIATVPGPACARRTPTTGSPPFPGRPAPRSRCSPRRPSCPTRGRTPRAPRGRSAPSSPASPS